MLQEYVYFELNNVVLSIFSLDSTQLLHRCPADIALRGGGHSQIRHYNLWQQELSKLKFQSSHPLIPLRTSVGIIKKP